MDDLNKAIRKVEEQLEQTERKITLVESQIEKVESNIENLRTLLKKPLASWEEYERGEYGNPEGARKEKERLQEEKERLQDKEKDLREEKKALRDKEKTLRDKEMLLLKQKDNLNTRLLAEQMQEFKLASRKLSPSDSQGIFTDSLLF